MNIQFKKKLLATLLVFFSTTLCANEDDRSEYRQHEVHVHGRAEMNILIDDTTFVFELNSPALNLLGFEHEPASAEENKTVKQVNEILADYKNLISVPDMNCEQSQNQITDPFGNEEEHEHHHGENHDDGHSEYYLFYSLACKDIKKIKQIKIKLFENFPGFESVDVKWTYFTDAGSMEATKEQKTIKIK